MKEYYKQLITAKSSDVPLKIKDPMEDIRTLFGTCEICFKPNVLGYGAVRPLIAFLSYCPTDDDTTAERLYTGRYGDKLFGMIKYLSDSLPVTNNVYFSSIFSCQEELVDAKIEGHIKEQSKRLNKEFELINPKNIVVLGYKAASILGIEYTDFDKIRGKQHTIFIDKYYPAFVTYSLEELYHLNSKLRGLVRNDLDFIISRLKL
jgi:uracil-DNA glycosylase family 4